MALLRSPTVVTLTSLKLGAITHPAARVTHPGEGGGQEPGVMGPIIVFSIP